MIGSLFDRCWGYFDLDFLFVFFLSNLRNDTNVPANTRQTNTNTNHVPLHTARMLQLVSLLMCQVVKTTLSDTLAKEIEQLEQETQLKETQLKGMLQSFGQKEGTIVPLTQEDDTIVQQPYTMLTKPKSSNCLSDSMKKFSLGQEQVENIFFASVPRSGSTWMRRLLEYSTNISTETFYLGEVPDNDRNGRPIDENTDQSWLRSQFDTKGSCEHIIYDGGGRNNRSDS